MTEPNPNPAPANPAPAANTGPANPPAPEPGKPAPTLLGDPAAPPAPANPQPGQWPETWRDHLAGEDKDARKQLDRYASPQEIWKKARELESKISSGEFKRDLPKDATPEQVNEWRKSRGIPDKADAYFDKMALPDGVVLSDADKKELMPYAEVALAHNIAPDAYAGLISKFYELQDQHAAQQAEADAAHQAKIQGELRSEWGPAEYQRNITMVKNLIAGWPEGLADSVLTARGPDGRLLGDNPVLIRQLHRLASELNPAATLVPAGGGTVQNRLDEIRRIRREQPDKYEADKAMQEEELKLIDADLKLKKRA